MQKYQPTLRIKYHSQMGSSPETRSFPFPESSFIAVTAYQNNKVTNDQQKPTTLCYCYISL